MLSDALLTLTNVTKLYRNREILRDVSLTINLGECIIIRGRNGSGKSTLLRIISGLIPITSGERLFKRVNVIIGYTPDRLSKLRMTSTEYLTHMGKISKVPRGELEKRIKELHTFFNLEQSTELKMTQYSKGMLQKVNLMQATLIEPDLLVLDEPFSGLDNESIDHLLESLKAIQLKGTAIIAAVHDPLLANQLENRTLWIEAGKLVEKAASKSCRLTIYDVICPLSDDDRIHLMEQFPDIILKLEEEGVYHMTVQKKDYQELIAEVATRGIEMISLQRKEVQS